MQFLQCIWVQRTWGNIWGRNCSTSTWKSEVAAKKFINLKPRKKPATTVASNCGTGSYVFHRYPHHFPTMNQVVWLQLISWTRWVTASRSWSARIVSEVPPGELPLTVTSNKKYLEIGKHAFLFKCVMNWLWIRFFGAFEVTPQSSLSKVQVALFWFEEYLFLMYGNTSTPSSRSDDVRSAKHEDRQGGCGTASFPGP